MPALTVRELGLRRVLLAPRVESAEMEMIREEVNGELYVYLPLSEHIVRSPDVCGGRPTFKYTRIEIAGSLDRLVHGESIESIVAGYGGRVSREALLKAIELAVRHVLDSLPDLATIDVR